MTDQVLVEKFEIIALAHWAEPLWWCGLAFGVEYPIHRIERNGVDVFVYVDGLPPVSWRYRLPSAYGQMVTDADIARVNIGLRCYTIRIALTVYCAAFGERVVDIRWQVHLVYHV